MNRVDVHYNTMATHDNRDEWIIDALQCVECALSDLRSRENAILSMCSAYFCAFVVIGYVLCPGLRDIVVVSMFAFVSASICAHILMRRVLMTMKWGMYLCCVACVSALVAIYTTEGACIGYALREVIARIRAK